MTDQKNLPPAGGSAAVVHGIETLAIHAGQPADPATGAVMTPIVTSATFAQSEPGKPDRFEYSRSGNPTRAALEACVAALEGGRHGFAFASGSAATMSLLHTLRPGDEVISGDDVYGGTFRMLDKVLAPLGVRSRFVDMRQLSSISDAFTDATRLVWLETPTNPTLKLFDIGAVCDIAKRRSVPVVVDNTFASPVLQRPLDFGATAVVHSTTKYINGHSDVVGGMLVTDDDELAERVGFLQNAIGAVPSPIDCYLVLRGIKTLPIRMRRHSESATELARRLEKSPKVARVVYPGLPSHEAYELCRRQMKGPGGMISVELEGGLDAARRFLSSLEIFTLAESLGGVESLAEHPALMTHASVPEPTRQQLGITDGLVRLSVGLEGLEDLWDDLSQALGRIG